LGLPLLVGLSRKSVLGQVVGLSVHERIHASIAASMVSVMKGANIVRVHDVKPTVDALKIFSAAMQN
jgi:dihydropteroate synthase